MKIKNAKRVSFSKWLKMAKQLSEKNIKWHEHYLFPDCIFNRKNKYVAILENEKTGEIFVSEAKKHKPKDLKKLEKLVFENVHIFKKSKRKTK